MSDVGRWDGRYRAGDTPWDTGRPSPELARVPAEAPVPPGRAVEVGRRRGPARCGWRNRGSTWRPST